jgi:hypothetical protein
LPQRPAFNEILIKIIVAAPCRVQGFAAPRRPNHEAIMRMEIVLAGGVLAGAVLAMTVGPAAAGPDDGEAPPFPRVVYALPPTPFVIPPTGYVLDPSDAAKPFYPVDSSPYAGRFGAVPYARPTYSEGGYAYADSYPYSDDPYGYGSGYGTPGYGPPAYAAPAYDPPGPGYYQALNLRPAGAPPYTAYRYRTAPNAKIIHLLPAD